MEVTECVRIGENELEVEVVNTWVNRLTGDALLRKSGRGTEAKSWTNHRSVWENATELPDSGLQGPVRLLGF